MRRGAPGEAQLGNPAALQLPWAKRASLRPTLRHTTMAKSKGTPTAPAPALTASLKRSAASEIDDLFASKKPKTLAGPPAGAEQEDSEMGPGSAEKRKAKKKDKGKGKAGPEEIVDTSAAIERYRPAPAPGLVKKRKAGEDDEGDEKMKEAESNFMDSRGTNSALLLFLNGRDELT